ncbi:CoA-acylating methylmalonate-semialdehyde dehydrogenase [Anaerobiospirillum thomasii]|uniref:Methylmalonate semialdehyde dehydrogenase [acylating] n=1 Tax=Anaerobiospirillum thomasii TaxID=179995 RepID=A0A2X0VCQ8_9GAMM|nr:CoA-acylating methylmalonate-semialdehyde dehydrogenase [Anaerobiospirillum thomasii]SPT70996.1 Methylmalonate semialdehyde dehydrogenase [acylating] [Anaerobiospirillum thomasii]
MERYFDVVGNSDPLGQQCIRQVKGFINGKWVQTATGEFRDAFNPSTGQLIAKVPAFSKEEMFEAIKAAKEAYPAWSDTPVHKRCQILFRMRHLVAKHQDELVELLAMEQGKTLPEAAGDVLKALEVIDFACGMPQLMKGESIMNVSKGYDTVLYREPMGVFLGLVPWNFPAMIPHGWMIPLAIAAGNTFVLKAATADPQSALRFMELWKEAGLPDGVVNIVTCKDEDIHYLIEHEDIKGVSFVGSTGIGQLVYEQAAKAGKRVQCLGEAKNHALVMDDAVLDRTASGIINAFCGCAGERCMALPVVVAQEGIADKLVEKLVEKAKELKMGRAYAPGTTLGPVVSARRKEAIINWIETGIKEGAKLVLDGRNPEVEPGCENGFFVGPTILDNVTPEMTVGQREIFGPVLCIKRVKTFEEGLALMNANPFANGSVIYTSSGYYARKFARYTDGGQVGINVGIPVPVCCFGFTGHKKSFIGDLHVMGTDGVRFFTESKNVTSTWFLPDHNAEVDTWDGSLASK